jgi:hypothetical protein
VRAKRRRQDAGYSDAVSGIAGARIKPLRWLQVRDLLVLAERWREDTWLTSPSPLTKVREWPDALVEHIETSAVLTEALALHRSTGWVEVPPFNDEPFADHWLEKELV